MPKLVSIASKAITIMGNGVLIAAASQSAADKIKKSLSFRNEPVITVTHDGLFTLAELPALLILDITGLKSLSSFQRYIKLLPTIILSPEFNEDNFLTLYDWGVLDYLVKPIPEAYLVAKALQGLKQNQMQQQMVSYKELLLSLGVVSTRSGTLTTPYIINTLKKSVDAYYLSPDIPTSLLLIEWEGLPSNAPEKLKSTIYTLIAHAIEEAARANDTLGEFLEDKFVLILPNTMNKGALSLIKRLEKQLKEYNFPQNIRLKFFIGSAQYQAGQHYEQWLQHAMDKLAPLTS